MDVQAHDRHAVRLGRRSESFVYTSSTPEERNDDPREAAIPRSESTRKRSARAHSEIAVDFQRTSARVASSCIFSIRWPGALPVSIRCPSLPQRWAIISLSRRRHRRARAYAFVVRQSRLSRHQRRQRFRPYAKICNGNGAGTGQDAGAAE